MKWNATMPNLALLVLRMVFLLGASLLGIFLIKYMPGLVNPPWLQWLVLGGVILIALAVIGLDMAVVDKQLDTISALYFGLIVGLFLTYVVGLALEGLPIHADALRAIRLIIGMVLCYGCVSLLLQTKNDFRFIIPYVEFSKEVKGARPYVLDTSVVIDGRIADVVETKILDSQLIMPRFVLNELQSIADSADRMRRSRGRRGLDILNRLRGSGLVDLQMYDRELPEFAGQTVDLKLVLLAKHLDGKIITNDYNLNKVAKLHGVGVLNLNDLANALKPVFLPGEVVEVRLIKAGEEAGQGVGYLDDGTMVVVEAGRDHLNQNVKITVTSVLQTSAGRMVFGKYDSLARA
jgi:uncharacterized protein YacL